MRVLAYLAAVGLIACAGAAQVPPGGATDLGVADLDDGGFVMPKKDGGSSDLAKSTDLLGIDLHSPFDMVMLPDMAGGGPVNVGDRCSNPPAPVMTPGVTYMNQDTTPLADDYNVSNTLIGGPCFLEFAAFDYAGRDGAYQITVPPKKTLTVTLTVDPSTAWDPMVAIVTSCSLAGFTCLGGSDGITNTEIATWENTDQTQSAAVFILVDAWMASEFGKYSIRADFN